ncbi:hypothetical protein [Siphovirus Jomon_CT89]|nr:hypothetical protein [Siphovirus Jomon_CT89]
MSDRPIESRYNCVVLASGYEVDADYQQQKIAHTETAFWYLVEDSSDYYHLYKAGDVEETLLVRGVNLGRIDPCTAPVASFYKEDYRWRSERGTIILEYVPMDLASLRLIHDGKPGIESFIEDLPTRASSFTENQLRTFIYEIDLLGDELDGLMSPEQVKWIDSIHDILMEESDARWLIQRLQDHGIVHLERG